MNVVEGRVYSARSCDGVDFGDGFPIAKCKVLEVGDVVKFSTEWPIREMEGRYEDFVKYCKEIF